MMIQPHLVEIGCNFLSVLFIKKSYFIINGNLDIPYLSRNLNKFFQITTKGLAG